MATWLIFALMTGLAIVAVLWPLSRRRVTPAAQIDERAFYQQRLAEIARDESTGFIAAPEAEAARAEAARRLLREQRSPQAGGLDGDSEYALRRRRAASAIALSTIPLITLAIYGAVGSPDMPSLPVAEREAKPLGAATPDEVVARVERRLASQPDDGAGWEMLAPVYQRLGRHADAVKARANAMRLLGETPERLARYGEALVALANGIVEAPARQIFEKALAADPAAPMPKFYLAVAAGQDGDAEGALKAFEALLASAPADAPWRGAVEARIAGLRKQQLPGSIAAAPEDAQTAAIAGMVSGLAARLQQQPDNAEGWAMLIRSYMVLDRKDDAARALLDARRALAARPDAVAQIDALGRQLQLPAAQNKP